MTACNEVGARLCFYTCLCSVFCSQRGVCPIACWDTPPMQGLFAGCIYVGSGDPVRVLHLLHTTNMLDTLEAFIAETYVKLAATKLRATLLVAAAQLLCCGHSANALAGMNSVLYDFLNSELV